MQAAFVTGPRQARRANVACGRRREWAEAVPAVDKAGRLFGLVTLRHYAELAAAGEAGSEPAPLLRP